MKACAYIAFLVTVFSSIPAASAQETEPYRLGIQDRLRIHVHEWPLLTGEFVIGAGGSLALPLIGEIPASGLNMAELGSEISKRLREKAQLDKAPDTTVDVALYRPFYILGGVERPGEYNYRPEMLVINAVAIAGGIYRPPRASDWGFERDAITGRGDLRLASVRRDELRARELRLKAEADGLETFPPPPADMLPGARKFVKDEHALFTARLERHRNQYVAMGETIGLYEGEIKALQGQIASARKQYESVGKELEDTRQLVARSLVPAPRVLPIERTLAQIERELKEIDAQIMRSRQQINITKSQRETLKDERRSTALTELQALEAQSKELDERIETSARLIAGSGEMLSNPQEIVDSEGTPSFIIIRQQNGTAVELAVSETAVVQPGDILKVFRPRDVSSSRRNTAGKGG
jgi:protein involved in polysaccharide export with SLBB domain